MNSDSKYLDILCCIVIPSFPSHIENGWFDLPNMLTERFDIGMDSLNENGKWTILTVGGIGDRMSDSSTIETFDLESSQWTVIEGCEIGHRHCSENELCIFLTKIDKNPCFPSHI